jgi:hypothetical protein
LAEAYVRSGQIAKGIAFVSDEIADARNSLPPDSVQLAQALASAGLNLINFKAWPDAEPVLRECLQLREKLQPDSWSTFNTKSTLGGALLGQKKYADAEPLLLAGYEGMKQREATIPPQGKIRLTEALERLVQLCEATDRKDKATGWQAKLDAARAPASKPMP